MHIRKYFGTDGIRGRVGSIPITPDFILKLGWAAGKILSCNRSREIIVGKDTRVSGYMLESALGAGLAAAGLSTLFTGPIPTPAVAYLTRIYLAEAGIVISASHNPFYDNGIKFFSIDGTKLSDKVELAIEAEMNKNIICVDSTKLGRISHIVDAVDRYTEFCKSTFPDELSLNGLKIVIDCANGSTYQVAPNLFSELGAKVIAIGCKPNGLNINNKLGSTDINILKKSVLMEKADLGIAFDGDGDRVIMVDHQGNKINGDQIIYIIARENLRQGKLNGGVVGTLMSNMGLELALKKLDIPFTRVNVGDRYIMEKLKENSWRIGAENSGHIILLDKTTTGDGLIASLQVIEAMLRNYMSLLDISSGIKIFPQVLINVNLNKSNSNLLENYKIKSLIDEIRSTLKKQNGRVILRKSGTEPLFRIMLEGEDESKVTEFAYLIADTFKSINVSNLSITKN